MLQFETNLTVNKNPGILGIIPTNNAIMALLLNPLLNE